MAKKKKKFKKKIGQNLNERLAQIEKEEKPLAPLKKENPEANGSKSEASDEKKSATNEVSDKYAYVKKDIRRDFLIILSLIAILTVVTVVGVKTDLLQNFADWIYQILNLKV